MLVIMDMEWIESEGRLCPTQLSALRVNEDWSIRDRFDRVMKPYTEKARKWKHVAYRGHRPEEFIHAPTAPMVFNELNAWLYPQDILCWWSEPTALTFIALHKLLVANASAHAIRLILPALQPYLKERALPKHRSAYVISDALGLPHDGPKHCSAIDVCVIRKLLEYACLPGEAIRQSLLPERAEEVTVRNLEIFSKATQDAKTVQSAYWVDLKSCTAHRDGCEKICSGSFLTPVDSLKGLFKTVCRPCRCCREEYWQFSLNQAEKNIRKMQLSFVYTSNDGNRLFHKPCCIHVRHMPYTRIIGAVRYKTCVAHGYQPCGWCRPKPSDEMEPEHVYTTPKKTAKKPERTLPRIDLNAIKRHEAAVRERKAIPANLSGTASHDAFILSQSSYAFWSAAGYQNFHLRNCPKLAAVSNLRGYARYCDAQRLGLTPCRLCKPTAKHDIIASVPIYQRQRPNESLAQIDALCSLYGWTHRRGKSEYSIETPVGKWKLIPGTYPLEVYHMNKVDHPAGTSDYHRQHRTFLSMTDTVEYIRRHDGDLMEAQRRCGRFTASAAGAASDAAADGC